MPGLKRRVLVVEDEPLMAELLARSLRETDFEVEVATDVEQARKAINKFDPDIVLLDISLGDGPTGVHLAHSLRRTHPDIGVLILTKHADAKSASKEGLDLPENVGFLRKHMVTDVPHLLNAIELVLSDRPQAVRQDLIETPTVLALDGKALAILELLAMGFNNSEIAIRSKLSIKSVERWIEKIYKDLGINPKGAVNPRVEAVRLYFREIGIPERTEPQ